MSLSEKIAELKQNLLTSINSLKTILQENGVTVSDDDTLTTLIQKVETIQAGVGDEEIDQLILDYGYTDAAKTLEDSTSKAIEISKSALEMSHQVTSTIVKDWNNVRGVNERYAIIFIPNVTTTKPTFGECINMIGAPTFDATKWTTMFFGFGMCRNLREINIVNLDTSKFTVSNSYYRTFYECNSLKKITGFPSTLPTAITGLSSFFEGCNVLELPYINTAQCTSMSWYLPKLPKATQDTFPELDLSGVAETDTTQFSNAANKLSAKNMSFAGVIKCNLTMPGDNYTRETMLNIFDHLYDYTGGTTHTLQLGSTSLARLTDEDKAIAINKNWTLS